MVEKIIAVVGPTACGKTRRAVELAHHFNGEIISADSRQIYRGMSIGTGKDLCEYGDVPYHLIDIADAGEKYNLFRYLQDFRNSLNLIREHGRRPIVCGGTGMYVENALNGIVMPEVPEDPELRAELESMTLDELTDRLSKYKTLHNSTDVDTCKRAIRAIEIQEYYLRHPEEALNVDKKSAEPLDAVVIGLDIPREERRDRITRRLDQRLEEGMIDEVRSLIASGVAPQDLIYYGLEYKFVTLHVIGALTYNEMRTGLETAIHQFAKRQMTWFRGMEKRGTKINWLPYDIDSESLISEVNRLIQDKD